MKHVMIDLETLATTSDAVILSIGAVKFNLETDELDDAGFYASLSVQSNLNAGRVINEDTLKWWFNQPKAAQAVFSEPKMSLEDGLNALTEWLGHNKRFVWSNGASFDVPMLQHAYAGFGWDTPWEFWNSRCMRTYTLQPGASRVTRPANDHNALRDAVNQARYVQAIYAATKGVA